MYRDYKKTSTMWKVRKILYETVVEFYEQSSRMQNAYSQHFFKILREPSDSSHFFLLGDYFKKKDRHRHESL